MAILKAIFHPNITPFLARGALFFTLLVLMLIQAIGAGFISRAQIAPSIGLSPHGAFAAVDEPPRPVGV